MVVGRSMINTVEIALSMGYLKIQPKLIIKSEQARKFPDNQIVILTTGSQGEEGAGLARMARGEHKLVHIKKGDTTVLSSSPIPGNERAVAAVMSNLTRLGANVVYNKVLDIHSSGHAHQEELKLMMNLLKPKYFMPIHGEHSMLVEHGRLAAQVGIPESNIFIPENGSSIDIDLQGNAKIGEARVAGGYVYVDGLGVNDVNEVVIRDRKQMASDGMFVIIATVNKLTGKLESQDIISRGFVYMKDNDELIREVKHEVRKLTESKGKTKLEPTWVLLRQSIRDEIGEYLFQKTERRPMILPVIIEV
jgi:ribonuclease J